MAIASRDELKEWWSGRLAKLVGKKITQVSYMSDSDAEKEGWDKCAVVIILDDGTCLSPMRDDEGNGPGAMTITFGTDAKGLPRTIPVI